MKLNARTLILCLGAILQPTLDAKAEQVVDPFLGRWEYNGPDNPKLEGDQQLRSIVFNASIGDSLATFSISFEEIYPVTACYYFAVRDGATLTSVVLNNFDAFNEHAGVTLAGTESDCPTVSQGNRVWPKGWLSY